MPGEVGKTLCVSAVLWVYHPSSSSLQKAFKVRECPLRPAGGRTCTIATPTASQRTLIYGERNPELSHILVAGIKRAFLLTTDHIPGILPGQNIPENECDFGHSPHGGARLGRAQSQDRYSNVLTKAYFCPSNRNVDLKQTTFPYLLF